MVNLSRKRLSKSTSTYIKLQNVFEFNKPGDHRAQLLGPATGHDSCPVQQFPSICDMVQTKKQLPDKTPQPPPRRWRPCVQKMSRAPSRPSRVCAPLAGTGVACFSGRRAEAQKCRLEAQKTGWSRHSLGIFGVRSVSFRLVERVGKGDVQHPAHGQRWAWVAGCGGEALTRGCVLPSVSIMEGSIP